MRWRERVVPIHSYPFNREEERKGYACHRALNLVWNASVDWSDQWLLHRRRGGEVEALRIIRFHVELRHRRVLDLPQAHAQHGRDRGANTQLCHVQVP